MEFNRCLGCMEEKQQHPICEHCGFDERTRNNIHQLPLGSILRCQYLIGRVLGQGGFGITYLAWDVDLDMPVAIKEYFPTGLVTRDISANTSVSSCQGEDSLSYEETKKRFLREGKALAKFSHLSHVVRILSLFRENNTAYLVMEYLQGQTLQQYLEEHGTLSYSQVLGLLEPLMEDLQTIHQSGIIHRDISPDNIMLTRQGQVKLLDFGTVRQVEDSGVGLSRSTEAILKHGFAPLEQYNTKGSLGPWTDVYALCATICYCLSKTLPPDAPDRVFADAPDQFIEELPITEPQKQVFKMGMTLRPSDRTASISALLEQLKAAASQEPSKQQAPREEAPKMEAPKAEAPKADAPKVETPKAEAPKTEAPKPETPKAEAPKAAAPKTETPRAEVPNTEKSKVEAPQKEPVRREPPKEASPVQPVRKRPGWLIPVCAVGAAAVLVIGGLMIAHFGKAGPASGNQTSLQNSVREPAAADPELVLKNFDPAGDASTVFGTDIPKDRIASISFQDSLDAAPQDAVDVSEAGKDRVLLWTQDAENGLKDLIIAGDGQVILPEDSRFLFGSSRIQQGAGYSNLKSFRNVSVLNAGMAVNLSSLFQNCVCLEQLDLSSLRTAAATDMSHMFDGCQALVSLELSGFNTSAVTNMAKMFYNCKSLPDLALSSFDTAQVTDMQGMFGNCASLRKLDLSGFRTEKTAGMGAMFAGCSQLQTLDLSHFTLPKEYGGTQGFFAGCDPNLKFIVPAGEESHYELLLEFP